MITNGGSNPNWDADVAMSTQYSASADTLHPKRPALIPLLDSIVQKYLQHDDLGARAPFAERALGLVRGYQRDLDRNQAALRAVR